MSYSLLRWERLLAHSHWFTLRAFGRELHLCARCSGIVLGFASAKILLSTSPLMSHPIPLYIGLPVSLFLALPTIVDWTTQSLGFRQSNNNLRLTTGFFEGIGIVFLSLAETSSIVKLAILAAFGLAVLAVGIFGRKLVQKSRLL